MRTNEALMNCSKSLTDRYRYGGKEGDFTSRDLHSGRPSARSTTSSVDFGLNGNTARSHSSSVWTGRDSSYHLDKPTREYVREVFHKQWHLREGREKKDVMNQMVDLLHTATLSTTHIHITNCNQSLFPRLFHLLLHLLLPHTHMQNSRLMGSLMYSGYVGEKAYQTENKTLLTPKYLTPREAQDVASLRRPVGEFTRYMNASIQKNVSLKAVGH